MDGSCCLLSLPSSPTIGSSGYGVCPDGTRTAITCLNGNCWNGKLCYNGFCCAPGNGQGAFESWCPGLNSIPFLQGDSTKSCSMVSPAPASQAGVEMSEGWVGDEPDFLPAGLPVHPGPEQHPTPHLHLLQSAHW